MHANYSIATYSSLTPSSMSTAHEIVASAIECLLAGRNSDGTWGSGGLDKVISTSHCLMALFLTGLPASSSVVLPGLTYLSNLDSEKEIFAFWRAAALFGLRDDLVDSDIEHLWRLGSAAPGHHRYHPRLFLWKLLVFRGLPRDIERARSIFAMIENGEVDIFERASIASMVLGIVDRAGHVDRPIRRDLINYLLASGGVLKDGRASFGNNLVDDAFVVFNVCESPAFFYLPEAFRKKVEGAVLRLMDAVNRDGRLHSAPPFGGTVHPWIYPTAVFIRATLSYLMRFDERCVTSLGVNIVHRAIGSRDALGGLWGSCEVRLARQRCFVIAPFDAKSTEVFFQVILPVVADLGIDCIRGDHIHNMDLVMNGVWREIRSAEYVIADVSDANPNVLYELGLAHAIRADVILISGDDFKVPFDVAAIRHVRFSRSDYESLRRRLRAALETSGAKTTG